MKHKGSSHPKEDKLVEAVKSQMSKNPNSLIIIFSQFRDTISILIQRLNREGYQPVRFVGQAHRKGDAGLSQKEQAEILDRFRRREFNIMVASSVAEEGLDIPAVDLVVFYEPVPSEIRTIQRRGRTGRSEVGMVTVLVTEDSRDEAFLYAEIAREKKMRKIVRKMGQRARTATLDEAEELRGTATSARKRLKRRKRPAMAGKKLELQVSNETTT
jgi:Fanconi anemia group M protein